MGRVGSQWVAYSLFAQGYAAVHAHYLVNPLSAKDAQAKTMCNHLKKFPGSDLKVICLVRNPAKRNVSAYFENKVDGKGTLSDFLVNYNHGIPDNWLKTELEGLWRLNLEQLGFNKKKGWLVHDDILIMKLEVLSTSWANGWTALTGNMDVPLLRRAGSSHKPTFEIPDSYVEYMSRSRCAQLFYETEEL